MNQFKKAKEKNLLAGQKVEKVSDLRKAGIEPEKNIEIAESLQKEKEIVINTIVKETTSNEIENSTDRNNNNNLENSSEELIKNTVQTPIQEIPIPQAVETISIIPEKANEKVIIEENTIKSSPIVQAPIEIVPIPIPAKMPEDNVPQKKKIPNIFAPKEEAKSMRKSLVLKPTSVKKAENYCSKNGGSFNELIQTLLDNFIDEYGL